MAVVKKCPLCYSPLMSCFHKVEGEYVQEFFCAYCGYNSRKVEINSEENNGN